MYYNCKKGQSKNHQATDALFCLNYCSLLKDKEDKALEAALHLSSEVKKGRCCSWKREDFPTCLLVTSRLLCVQPCELWLSPSVLHCLTSLVITSFDILHSLKINVTLPCCHSHTSDIWEESSWSCLGYRTAVEKNLAAVFLWTGSYTFWCIFFGMIWMQVVKTTLLDFLMAWCLLCSYTPHFQNFIYAGHPLQCHV